MDSHQNYLSPITSTYPSGSGNRLRHRWLFWFATFLLWNRGGGQDLFFGFHDADVVWQRFFGANLSTWVPRQHNLYFDSQYSCKERQDNTGMLIWHKISSTRGAETSFKVIKYAICTTNISWQHWRCKLINTNVLKLKNLITVHFKSVCLPLSN